MHTSLAITPKLGQVPETLPVLGGATPEEQADNLANYQDFETMARVVTWESQCIGRISHIMHPRFRFHLVDSSVWPEELSVRRLCLRALVD